MSLYQLLEVVKRSQNNLHRNLDYILGMSGSVRHRGMDNESVFYCCVKYFSIIWNDSDTSFGYRS